MLINQLKRALRFYFITEEDVAGLSPLEQVKIAIRAGATFIQYRNKTFSSRFFEEVAAIRNICKCNSVPFVINDNILLAKAVSADGVHLGQEDEDPTLAKRILGAHAIVGKSVSDLDEFYHTNLSDCDYIGTGPVFPTHTKKDAKKAIGLSGLKTMVTTSPVPVVAIGGIDQTTASACIQQGAAGVAVISVITRAKDPFQNALQVASACGCAPPTTVLSPWNDEFKLIDKLIQDIPSNSCLKTAPGDDACLLMPLNRPVITTDVQREGIHFRFDWQTAQEVGRKAVEATLSDLAASYATPVCLFVNLTLPDYISEQVVENIYQGIKRTLAKHNCTLGGGNISAGSDLALDLFAVGSAHKEIFPKRSAAVPGFGLYCTGPLGLARAGLLSLIRNDHGFKEPISKFISPSARFDAVQVLAKNRIPCVIDISDGLAGDAKQIAKASNISIALDLEPSMFSPALVSFCEKYHLNSEEMMLAGGEDYELLFACPEDVFENVKKELPEVYAVGRCLEFQGMHLVNLPENISSFQHGKR
ncbi:MAG: thiamine-phosphate kinase [Desulfobacterales bacterium]